MNKGLIALAIGTFALGIAEFTMMGVLSDVAGSLDIGIAKAGHMITAYASGVCVGAPALIVFRRMPLRRLLVILAALIVAGNLFAALAPGYWTLLAARFISGLPHGAYFGVSSIVAQKLVRPGRGAEAIAAMVGGMTVANVVGVPGATLVSNLLSWRIAFAIVAVIGVAAVVGIRSWIPALQPLPDRGMKGQFAFLKSAAPWLILGATFFGQGSVYCWYSYVEPVMTQIAGFPTSAMTWIMVLAGAGMVVGNFLGGRLADRFSAAYVAAWIAGCVVLILPAIYFLDHIKWVSLVLMFLATAALFGIGGPMQYLIVRFSKGGEMLGGAGIQIAFNVSNAVASLLGGMAIHHGYGVDSPALIGIPFAVIATATLVVLGRRYGSRISEGVTRS